MVDGETLGFVEEERLVDAAGEIAVEVWLGGGGDDEDVGAGGDAAVRVVDHLLVAVEGEAVVHVALDAEGCDGALVGGLGSDLLGKGAGGVIEIEIFAVEAEQEDERGADGHQSVGADVRRCRGGVRRGRR